MAKRVFAGSGAACAAHAKSEGCAVFRVRYPSDAITLPVCPRRASAVRELSGGIQSSAPREREQGIKKPSWLCSERRAGLGVLELT
jgi:hypothetical protein